jgi:hypothetical protein
VIADAYGAPRTADFRQLAAAAATAIYTWDTRTSSYSEVYSRLRDWWDVLPDGSNPLAVLVQEFEATGVNAGSYATLADQQAHRSAAVESLHCDSELAKVRERPAPWEGLHVCTVSVSVVDQSISNRNAYTAPSASWEPSAGCYGPTDHCVMVGFTPHRAGSSIDAGRWCCWAGQRRAFCGFASCGLNLDLVGSIAFSAAGWCSAKRGRHPVRLLADGVAGPAPANPAP